MSAGTEAGFEMRSSEVYVGTAPLKLFTVVPDLTGNILKSVAMVPNLTGATSTSVAMVPNLAGVTYRVWEGGGQYSGPPHC
ncbi:hypothetical protein [Absidia glauca]|uniref:Uncharacterized protein n=1 Tax=Absidia glauca TaxID=4829 RepID=A0A163IVZ8_ABSGL|nr:hypothetical protein [Absidia glauca]